MATAVQIVHSSASSNHQPAPPSTAPVLEFVCLFTHDLRRKQKRWQDGRLKYHTFNRRIMVHDERGNFIGDTHWREDCDFDEGEELELERGGVVVQVGECTGSRDQDLSELIDKRAQEKAERQAAAMARRQATRAPATPAANPPHFQLRHKPLHHLIGTPTGKHGRAIIPKESPYEERQKLAVTPQSDAARPAKRRKREVSPPSKGGYARALFGTALTLSGAPASTPLIRSRLPRSPSVLIDDSTPTSSNPAPHESKSDPAPEVVRSINADPLRERRINAPRPQLLKSIPRAYPSNQVAEPGSPSAPIEIESISDDDRSSAAATTKPALKRKEKTSSRARNNDLLQPISANRPTSPKRKGRLDLFGDVSSLASSGRKEVGVSVPTRGVEPSARNQVRSIKSSTKSAELPNPKIDDDANEEQHISEPKTELRIRQRKKRGLLMMSESLDVDNSPTSRRVKSRPDRPSPSTSFEDTTLGDTSTALAGIALGQEKAVDSNIGDHEEGGVSLPKSRRKQSKERRERQREAPIIEDPEPTLDAPNHLIQDDSSKNIASSRKRSRATDRRKRSPSPPLEDPLLFEPPVLNDAPTPRLARLGRKSVRSKEVIGFAFDEDDFSSAPPPSKSRSAINKQDHVTTQPQNQSTAHSATPATKHPNLTRTNSDRAATSDRLPDRALADNAKKAVNDAIIESVHNLRTAASYVEPIQQDRVQEQTGPVPVSVNTEPHPQARIPETTTTLQQLPSKRVANPATRGKKAAQPSDAAGQVPKCPLPPEVAVGKPLENSKPKPKPGNRPGENITSPMPGFSRANGGPWSREAYDLLESARPG
ncbi:hypothetical protein GGR53DRAFT_446597 [Hypoxylon sp. FL1150]|nr:hypothetical protein GGR53DRAFT_446597 [Hypoxylon sp. FL1150]